MPSRKHADFSWRRQYRCSECQTVITTGSRLVKRNFGFVPGEDTYLFRYAENVNLGEGSERRFTNWLHCVKDVHCNGCGEQVGWKVTHTYDHREASHVGKFILEESWFERHDESWEEVKARKAAEKAESDALLLSYKEQKEASSASKRQRNDLEGDATSTTKQAESCTCGSKRLRTDVQSRDAGVQATEKSPTV